MKSHIVSWGYFYYFFKFVNHPMWCDYFLRLIQFLADGMSFLSQNETFCHWMQAIINIETVKNAL